MPSGTVLKSLLEREIDDTLDNPVVLDYFNGALRDLALVARKKFRATVPFLATDRSVALPTSLVEVKEVRLVGIGSSTPLSYLALSYGLEIYGDAGSFEILWTKDLPFSGDFEIRGYRYPAEMTSLTNTPDLPDFAHNALVYFAAREFFDGDDELESRVPRDQKYQIKKAELDVYTSSNPASPKVGQMDSRPPWYRG